jgi:hypothetical protein
MKHKFTVNKRLLTDLIPNHINTFSAFCELINNSIQAHAKNISIKIEYAKDEDLSPIGISKISIEDDGVGVYSSEIDDKTLNIGTSNKQGGKGIGRFCAFQIGKKFIIETVGKNQESGLFSKSIIPIYIEQISDTQSLDRCETETKEEILKGKNHKTGYKVTIEDLYTNEETEKQKDLEKRIYSNRKMTQQFRKDQICEAIFERYPKEIFSGEITFYVNNKALKKDSFIEGTPERIISKYTDKKGEEYNVTFDYYKVKKINKIQVFLTVDNAGMQTVSTNLEYDATWLSPKIGGWYVYINSDALSSDNFRNIDLGGLDEGLTYYKNFIKDSLNVFFKEKNKEFDDFTKKLKLDEYYPYKTKESSSKSKELLFDKLAYLVEDKYQILNNQEKLREIVYPLIDKTISNGQLENILKEILKLDNKILRQFDNLLQKSDLEDIIEFSDKVSSKMQDLDFIEKIVYSEISKHIKERCQLHKYLEKMLWIFGEEYSENTRLLSDKNLENNLNLVRKDCMKYKQSPKADNVNKLDNKKLRSITDLFFYSKRLLDAEKFEVLIVELKAPRVKISQNELDQAKRYALEIESKPEFANNVKYRIILISSDINKNAENELKGIRNNSKNNNPYYFFSNEANNIIVEVMRWSDLINSLKRKLNYLSNFLKTKDVDIKKKAEKDFEEIESKTRSSLKRVN